MPEWLKEQQGTVNCGQTPRRLAASKVLSLVAVAVPATMEESLQAEETLHAAPEQAVPEHGTEEQLQAQADAAAAQMAALPLDLATLALPQALDIPQLAGLEYAGVAVPGQPNLM